MEPKDCKRKAQEIAASPRFVLETINELTTVLMESDAILRAEISELRDKVGKLEKQLSTTEEECARFQEEVAFFHPDAIIDRIRTKLWHHGDLSLLRRAIERRSRKLRSTDFRGDRSLYLCDAPSKRSKPTINEIRGPSFSPKHENEEALMSPPTTSELVNDNADTEEIQEDDHNGMSQLEDEVLNGAPTASETNMQATSPLQNDGFGDGSVETTLEFEARNDALTGVLIVQGVEMLTSTN